MPAFVYPQPQPSPYISDMLQLMVQGGQARAAGLQQAAQAIAQGRQQAGQIYGQFLSNVGQIPMQQQQLAQQQALRTAQIEDLRQQALERQAKALDDVRKQQGLVAIAGALPDYTSYDDQGKPVFDYQTMRTDPRVSKYPDVAASYIEQALKNEEAFATVAKAKDEHLKATDEHTKATDALALANQNAIADIVYNAKTMDDVRAGLQAWRTTRGANADPAMLQDLLTAPDEALPRIKAQWGPLSPQRADYLKKLYEPRVLGPGAVLGAGAAPPGQEPAAPPPPAPPGPPPAVGAPAGAPPAAGIPPTTAAPPGAGVVLATGPPAKPTDAEEDLRFDRLQAAKNLGQPISAADQAFLDAYKTRRTMVTTTRVALEGPYRDLAAQQRETARSDRSFYFNQGEINTLRKPIADRADRVSRLVTSLDQRSPVADASIAPEILSVMAGGPGSGLRMNEAEIARQVGGRSNWESLKAALMKWNTDPSKALSITDAQRQQMYSLVRVIAQRSMNQLSALRDADRALISADSVEGHRTVLADLHDRLDSLLNLGGGGPGGGGGKNPFR